jgi:hypothetical protein
MEIAEYIRELAGMKRSEFGMSRPGKGVILNKIPKHGL